MIRVSALADVNVDNSQGTESVEVTVSYSSVFDSGNWDPWGNYYAIHYEDSGSFTVTVGPGEILEITDIFEYSEGVDEEGRSWSAAASYSFS